MDIRPEAEHLRQRVAVLSNGPSVASFDDWTEVDWDLRIGAARTAARWRVDWWAFVDWDTFRDHVPAGWPEHRPKLYTSSVVPGRIQERGDEALRERFYLHPWIGVFDGTPVCATYWNNKSGLVALALALQVVRPPADLLLFGYDMAGEADFTGEVRSHFRHEPRWVVERGLFDRLVAEAPAGIEVRRIV